MPHQEPEFFLKSKEEVVAYIASWKKQKEPLRIDPHLNIDRPERHVSIRDCDYVLTTDTANTLQWPPMWDEKHRYHVLHIIGTDLDGEPVKLLFVINSARFTIVVFNWLANV
jgi:hypothetical protein